MKTRTCLALVSMLAFACWEAAAWGQTATVQGNRVKVSDGASAVEVDLDQGARVKARTEEAGRAAVEVEDGRGSRVRVKAGATQVEAGPGGVKVKTNDPARPQESRRAPSRALEPLTIAGSDEEHDEECGGRDVDISGTDLKVHLRGECGRVEVTGSDNVIDLDAVTAIEVVGSTNKVTWVTGLGTAKPQISKTGSGNEVKQRRR